MNVAPKSKSKSLRAYFISLECLSVASTLASKRYGQYELHEGLFFLMASLALGSTALLLVSSIVCSFQRRWKLALSGFAVSAFFLLCAFLLPSGGTRY